MHASPLPPIGRTDDKYSPFPHPGQSGLAAGSAHGVLRQITQAGPQQPAVPRAAGGVPIGERRRARLWTHRGVLPRKIRNDPSAPLPVVTERELSNGILNCVNRGLIPSAFDVSDAFAGQNGPGTPGGPFSCMGADLLPHQEQFHRSHLVSSELGLQPICNVKLDLQPVLRPVPPQFMPPASRPPPHQQQQQPAGVVIPVHGDDEGKDSGKVRDGTRTYAELLDLYSLHEFVIRRGKALVNTPEFESFQRSCRANWGAVSALVRALENLLDEFDVPLVYVDGKKLAKLAAVDMGTPTQRELCACIVNRDEVLPLMDVPGRRFRNGEQGWVAAATRIQACARMFLDRVRYGDLKQSNLAALRIQASWKIHQNHMSTRQKLAQSRRQQEALWRQAMDSFIREWPAVKTGPRLIIHIASLSLTPKQCATIPCFDCVQNSQLARLLDLADPNVELVYISPFDIASEALQYYTKLLLMNGIQHAESRLQVMVPENRSKLPPALSLTKSLLFSQKSLKRLTSLVKGKVAYIVPGVVGKEDLALAAKLGVPLLGPNPDQAARLSAKSGSKRIFEAAEVPTPIGAYDMRDESELLVILAKFIADYRDDYGRWLIKIDHEFGGRGIAYIDTRKLKCIEEDRRDADISVLRDRVYQELKDYISKRAKIVSPQLYPDWAAFISDFNQHGGVLEAVPPDCVSSPSANIFIGPDGAVELLSVQEQVLSPAYCTLGASFPQTTVPHAAIRAAALSVGQHCFRSKIMGHASMDFVVYRKRSELRMWAVDLDLHLTNNALAHRLFEFTTGATTDRATGQCVAVRPGAQAGSKVQPRSYVYSGLVYHPYIGALRHSVFFNQCMQRGLAFDTEERTGTLFHIVDTLLRGCIGVLCIGRSEAEPIGLLSEAMEFIQQQLSTSTCDDADTNFQYAAGAARALFQKFVAERRHGHARGGLTPRQASSAVL